MANGLFTQGSGTLKSNNLPSALCELLILINNDERIANNNTQVLNQNNIDVPSNTALSLAYNTRSLNINVNIPLSFELIAGEIKIKAIDYLEPISNLIPSIDNELIVTGSSLTKTNKIEALFELVQLIQLDEETKNINRLNFNINGETKIGNLTASFNFRTLIDNTGKIELEVINYLA